MSVRSRALTYRGRASPDPQVPAVSSTFADTEHMSLKKAAVVDSVQCLCNQHREMSMVVKVSSACSSVTEWPWWFTVPILVH